MAIRDWVTRKQLTQTILATLGSFDEDGKKLNWRTTAMELYPHEDPNKTAALLWKLVNKPEYEPSVEICRRIMLVMPRMIPPCDTCGEVHEVPWCIYEADVEMVKPVNGHIPQGSQVLNYKVCECGTPFVPNTPLRKRCYTCSIPYKGRKP